MIIYPDFLPPRYSYLAFHAERSNSEVVDANLVEILCDRVCGCYYSTTVLEQMDKHLDFGENGISAPGVTVHRLQLILHPFTSVTLKDGDDAKC